MESLDPWEVCEGRAGQMTTWTNKIKEENGNACVICGYSKNTSGLHFHHVNPVEKSGRVTKYYFEHEARDEAKKCIITCANCHAEIHSGIISNDIVAALPRAVDPDEIFQEEELPIIEKRGRKRGPRIKKIVDTPDFTLDNLDDIYEEIKIWIYKKALRGLKQSKVKYQGDLSEVVFFFNTFLSIGIPLDETVLELIKNGRKKTAIILIKEILEQTKEIKIIV